MTRVLVADDDPDVRELIAMIVASEGHAVDCAASGRTALELLAREPYDLVICDLSMPDGDGMAVYTAIRQQPAYQPPVLFVSGYADAGPYEDFAKTARAVVLLKPFELDDLKQLIRKLLSAPINRPDSTG